MQKNRDLYLDSLKGIAVLAVLLGHAIQRGLVNDYVDITIFRIIYTFHMPLFMILSGYALKKYTKNYSLKLIAKKLIRLIIPTILWSLIIYVMRNFNFVGIKEFVFFPENFVDYLKELFLRPDYIIWFLPTVFLCSSIVILQNILLRKKKFYVNIFVTILLIVLFYINDNPLFGMGNLKQYFPLFMIGYYVPYPSRILVRWMIVPCLICYLLILPNYFLPMQNMVVYYFTALIVTVVLIGVVYYNLKSINEVLAFFGERSLEIYLCQCICLNIGLGTGVLRIVTIFLSATIISVALTCLLRKNKISNFLLFGRSYK